MPAGRPREPYEVRVGKGDLSNGPIPECVDRVPGTISPPDWLEGEALLCWHHITEILSLRGQLSRDSYWSVLSFCETWAEWLDLRADIAQNGRITKVLTTAGQRAKGRGKKGNGAPEQGETYVGDGEEDDEICYAQKIRPQVALFSDCDRRLRAWLTEFGLTDASRSKVGKPETPPLPKPKPKGKGDAPSIGDYGLSSH